MLASSILIKTSGGVANSIRIPIGEKYISWRADMSRVAESPYLKNLQGPVIEASQDGFTAQWVCQDGVHKAHFSHNSFDIQCLSKTHQFSIRTQKTADNTLKSNSPIVVISDLEGDLDFFITWAQSLGVLDQNNDWSFNQGHLVILGDVMDRGRHVYDLLWFIYHLEEKAQKAGGAVHLLLGNHEQYGFAHKIISVEAEHLWAIEKIMGYDKALSNDTILGAWLRDKDVLLKLNNVLFAHGGISPQFLEMNMSLDEINKKHKSELDNKNSHSRLFTNPHSPTQYRGYAYETQHYPMASQQQIEQTLTQYQADYIVVGHSQQESIKNLFSSKVFLIDSTKNSKEALFFQNGSPHIMQSSLIRQPYVDKHITEEPFDVLNFNHWKAFFGVFRQLF